MLPRYPLSNCRDEGTNAAQSLRMFQINHGREPSTANPNDDHEVLQLSGGSLIASQISPGTTK